MRKKNKRAVNALQVIVFIIFMIPSVVEWARAYRKGGRKARQVSGALIVSDIFLMLAGFIRLKQRIFDLRQPPHDSIRVWNLAILHSAIHYALSKGWFLEKKRGVNDGEKG